MIVEVCMNIRISRFCCEADPVRLKELRANGKLVDSDRVETGLILPDLPTIRVHRIAWLQDKIQRYD